jgi:hypothetical protein
MAYGTPATSGGTESGTLPAHCPAPAGLPPDVAAVLAEHWDDLPEAVRQAIIDSANERT